MKVRIIEVEREELSTGIYRRLIWANIPIDQLSDQDVNEFLERTDKSWPNRETISSLTMRKIRNDMKNRPNHFFETVSIPPSEQGKIRTMFSKN